MGKHGFYLSLEIHTLQHTYEHLASTQNKTQPNLQHTSLHENRYQNPLEGQPSQKPNTITNKSPTLFPISLQYQITISSVFKNKSSAYPNSQLLYKRKINLEPPTYITIHIQTPIIPPPTNPPLNPHHLKLIRNFLTSQTHKKHHKRQPPTSSQPYTSSGHPRCFDIKLPKQLQYKHDPTSLTSRKISNHLQKIRQSKLRTSIYAQTSKPTKLHQICNILEPS